MPARLLLFGSEAREAVFKGVTKLDKAVAATLGPLGRNAIIAKRFGGPTVTKDGVTVAKEVELPEPFENMGAQLVKEAATKTNDAAGDGTTTATVLAHAMMEEGMKHLGSGKNAISIKNGIIKAVAAVKEHLTTQAKAVSKKEEYAAVATISAQDSEIGEMIAEVIDQVGKDGVVTVEAGNTLGLEKEYVEGMQFESGWLSPYMVTDATRMETILENVHLLITDQKIGSLDQLLPLMKLLGEKNKRELVIIADNVEGQALALLVINRVQGKFQSVAVKAPAFGERKKEMLKDIAALTGGTYVSDELGMKLESVTIENLGKARKVIVTKDSTLIVGGAGKKDDVEARVNEIKIRLTQSTNDFDKEKLQERLAKLCGGVAVVKVGAATEVEQKEKQHRVEDALSATRAAAEEGIVPGGGTAYIRAIVVLDEVDAENDDEQIGIDIVRGALSAPARHIADNAGVEGKVVVEKVKGLKGTNGYNAMTGEYEDLTKAMVIDPKKVARCALENAASVAAMFLTLEVAIVEIPDSKEGDE
jgi:chaperonin GroEL